MYVVLHIVTIGTPVCTPYDFQGDVIANLVPLFVLTKFLLNFRLIRCELDLCL